MKVAVKACKYNNAISCMLSRKVGTTIFQFLSFDQVETLRYIKLLFKHFIIYLIGEKIEKKIPPYKKIEMTSIPSIFI